MSRYTRRTSSRLGRYERQKFGGLGGFLDFLYPDRPGTAPGAAGAGAASSEAPQESNGGFFSFLYPTLTGSSGQTISTGGGYRGPAPRASGAVGYKAPAGGVPSMVKLQAGDPLLPAEAVGGWTDGSKVYVVRPDDDDDGWDYGTDASDEDIIKNWESAYKSQRKADIAAGIGVPQAQPTADSGINWGDIGGFFTGLIGAAAPIAGGMYMGKQQAESQKDMMQLLLQGGKASAQPATVIIREGGGGGGKSKMGLYIGLGVVGLIVLIGGVALITR